MVSKVVLIAGVAALAVAGGGGAFALVGTGGSTAKKLVGDDFGQIRREALEMFPRGKPVIDVKKGLKDLGFLCAPAHRLMANINAPSMECDSAGRGYPTSSRMELTLMARNGALSDIAIGNGLDAFVADARTPDPNPGGHRAPVGEP